MMEYSRVGLYVPRKKKAKQSMANDKKGMDWMNVILFVLLVVVVIFFVMR